MYDLESNLAAQVSSKSAFYGLTYRPFTTSLTYSRFSFLFQGKENLVVRRDMEFIQFTFYQRQEREQ